MKRLNWAEGLKTKILDTSSKLFSAVATSGARFVDKAIATSNPQVSVHKAYEVRLELPSIKKDDVKVEVVGNQLVVSSEKSVNDELTSGGCKYKYVTYSSFRKVYALPDTVDISTVSASLSHGVLSISAANKPGYNSTLKTIPVR